MSGRVDRGGLVVVAAADVDVAAPVREKDVEEEEDAASPGAADLHRHRRPENEQIRLWNEITKTPAALVAWVVSEAVRRYWVCLLVTKTVPIETSARSP